MPNKNKTKATFEQGRNRERGGGKRFGLYTAVIVLVSKEIDDASAHGSHAERTQSKPGRKQKKSICRNKQTTAILAHCFLHKKTLRSWTKSPWN